MKLIRNLLVLVLLSICLVGITQVKARITKSNPFCDGVFQSTPESCYDYCDIDYCLCEQRQEGLPPDYIRMDCGLQADSCYTSCP